MRDLPSRLLLCDEDSTSCGVPHGYILWSGINFMLDLSFGEGLREPRYDNSSVCVPKR
jgi:hypothetical protein